MKTRSALRVRGWCALLGVATAAQLAPAQSAAPDSSVLRYREPARTWHEALPVGNGRLGALVPGGTDSELLHLNEGSVWSGRAADEFETDIAHARDDHAEPAAAATLVSSHGNPCSVHVRTPLQPGPARSHAEGSDLFLEFTTVAGKSYEALSHR